MVMIIKFFLQLKINIEKIKKSVKWNQKITRIGILLVQLNNYIKFNNKLKKINDYQGYIHNFKLRLFIAF